MRWLMVGALLFAGAPALAHGGAHGKKKAAKAAPAAKAEPVAIPGGSELDAASSKWFTETELIDQNGKTHRFYSDLVRGQKVVINFIFTSCKTACSPITARLAEVRKRLGSKLGREVRFLTLTVDPSNDRPEVLKKFATKFGAGPGWYFLTGKPENVGAVLKKLGGYTDDPEQHSTALLIGNPTTGHWLKVPAAHTAAQIAHAIEQIDHEG